MPLLSANVQLGLYLSGTFTFVSTKKYVSSRRKVLMYIFRYYINPSVS